MDKILQAGPTDAIQVTNDGATILKSIGIDNPAAKVLVGKKTYIISAMLIYKKGFHWKTLYSLYY